MSFSRIQVETTLVQRCGGLMTEVSFSTSTDGTNTNLDNAISYALSRLGYSVADPTTVTDAEIALLDTTDWLAFIDIATLQLLADILGNLALVDITVGPRKEALSQLARQIQNRMKTLQAYIQDEYGIGVGALETGAVDLNFQSMGDDTIV
jgi:hypothetical protein